MAIAPPEPRPSATLPRPIRRGLVRVDHKLRTLGALRGLGTVALVLALGAALGMAADFLRALPPGVRWAIWGAWVTSISLTLLALVVRPLARKLGWTDLAAVAERGTPGLGERLTGTVALLRDRPHGSPALIAALADQAAAQAETLDLAQAVPTRDARRRFATGMVALGLVLAPAVVRPDPFAALWHRFLAPWANLDRVGRFVLEVAPGDRIVALGSDLAVSATIRSRLGGEAVPDAAWLEWTDAQGAAHRVPMIAATPEPAPSRSFAVTLPKLTGSLRYRVASGPALSKHHRITAVEPPAVATLSATVEPPAYTKLPSAPAKDPARIEAWEGSRITLTVAANKPVRRVEVSWPAPEPAASSSDEKSPTRTLPLTPTADGKTWTASVLAEASGTYAFALRDEHDIANRPESPRRLVVRVDAPPVVALAGSDQARQMGPDEVLRLGVAARDDLAVASAELHYAIDRAGSAAEPEPGLVAAPLEGLGTRSAKGPAALDLKPLALKAGDVVTYRIRVADSRPAPRGPNVTWSQARSLTIVAQDEALARRDAAERAEIQAQLDAIKQANAANRRETEQLRYAADAAQRNNGPWDKDRQQALNGREAAARDVADRLQLLAQDLDDHPQFAPLARPTRQIAEIEAEGGREMLDQARRAPDAAKRLADLQQADTRLGAVQERLEELQRRLDALARLDDDRRHLRAMARRAEELAAQAAALKDGPAAERARLDQLQAEQEQLRRDLEELLRKSPELRAEALAANVREAEDLAARARILAERQREEARQTADLSRHADALKALADAQRDLEADARRLALRVNRPLEENGRARLNTDPLARAAEPIERGDLDAGRPRLDEAENELRRLARDLEDVRDDPKALARRLARRQETLRTQVDEAVREAKTPEDKAALAAQLKPLAERQEAIARLAEALPAPPPQQPLAQAAAGRTAQAAESLREPQQPRELAARQNDALAALNRLADALPDAHRRREPTRQRLAEARRQSDGVARDLERILRETAPKPGQPADPRQAAAVLADRLAPLAQRQADTAANLDTLDVEPRLEPQRQRAAHRAQELADALARARREALPAVGADARAALGRLEQKFNGQQPADDLAEELAADAADLKSAIENRPSAIGHPASDPAARAVAAADQRRLATALRALDAPDATIPQAEAVGRAEQAARALADPAAVPHEAVRQAAAAADALARRLTDRLPPQDQAAVLARAERALNGPAAPADPAEAARAQRAIAQDLARLPLSGPEQQAAAEQVDRAATLAERAAQPDGPEPAPAPAALAASRTRAAEALEALAARPAAPAAPAAEEEAPGAAAAGPRARAEELARRQGELAGEIRAAQARAAGQPDPAARLAEELAPLAARQEALAEATRALPNPHADGPSRREAAARPAAARVAQQRAAGALARTDAARAADLAGEAAKGLASLAQTLPVEAPAPVPAPPQVPADPTLALDPAQAGEARDLARRERRIREGVQALLAERIEPQQQLRDDAGALGRALADLRDRSREAGRAAGPAQAAADLLQNQAPQAMDQGTAQLAQGRPSPAREAQRRAAELVERAAQQAEDLGAALRAEAQAPAAGAQQADAAGPTPADLGSARQDLREAGRQLAQARDPASGPEAGQAASAAMRHAAQGLRAASQPPEPGAPQPPSLAGEPSTMPPAGTPMAPTLDPEESEAGTADPDLGELQALVRAKTGRAWGELPGHLRTEILQMSQGRYRDDYARLIQLYFREIAASDPASPRETRP